MSTPTITPHQLHEAVLAGRPVELIDVRTPVEFREVHAAGARNVPLDQLDPAQIAAQRRGIQEPLYVICKSGNRARQACEKLTTSGLTNVVNVEGGTQAWELASLPVVRGQKAISLERQVRIAAGSLVVVASLLGAFVSPYWIALAVFVGAGLVFAGVTDTCGMALLLARMPWNQVKASSSAAAACKLGGLVLAALLLTSAGAYAVEHTTDSLSTVRRGLAQQTALLVDVREKSEWVEGHVGGARLLPLSALKRGVSADDLGRFLPPGKVVYLHCAAGGRCLKAAAILRSQGYDARPLKQGYDELLEAGFSSAAGQ